MKKELLILAVAAVCVLAFSGCGKSGAEDTRNADSDNVEMEEFMCPCCMESIEVVDSAVVVDEPVIEVAG